MAEKAVINLDEQKRNTASYWAGEIDAAQKRLEKWHKRAAKIVRRYLGDHVKAEYDDRFALNLFHSNTKTVQDMLYSTLPKVEASRTNADSADDLARVAAATIERMINLDIAANGEEYDAVLRSVLQDRLVPGMGCARVRYEVETKTVQAPEQYDAAGFMITPATETTVVVREDAPIEYYHWQDVLWSWGRSFADLTWLAYRAYLTKAEVTERFGKKVANNLEYRKQKVNENADEFERDEDKSPLAKAEIWEIWDDQEKMVRWYGKGATTLLDTLPDPLQLTGFFPSPPFLIANATTSLYRPHPDFLLAQDLYNEVDRLQTRIAIITEAVKVVGVYDSSADGIKRMLKEGTENDLIPVDSWAMFAEGGGLKGKIDWLPLQEVADTLSKLQELRNETIRLLQMVTGMADIMQGALNSPYEGVGQSQLKAQFGSVRIQALQDQFARFAGDLMQLKAEVICKHFEASTILKQSNMQYSMDAEMVPAAIQLLQSPDMANIRIQVRPETVAMVDYARLKVERTEFLTAMATFMQSAAPMLEREPDSLPYLLKMLQWSMAGFKGSQEIEGVMDKAIEGAIQKAQQQQGQPDPEKQAEQQKQQFEVQKIQAKAQADAQTRQQDLQADLQTIQATHQAKMGEISATHQSRVSEIQQKLQSDLMRDQLTLKGDLQQIQAGADAEVNKDATTAEIDVATTAAEAQIELEKEAEKATLEIGKIGAQSAAKINEIIVGKKDDEKELDSD
jgi:hypothetical protein